MELLVSVENASDSAKELADSFVFSGISLHGAMWDSNSSALGLSHVASVTLPLVRFTWILHREVSDTQLNIPVYQDVSRMEYLFGVKLPICENVSTVALIQRGTCLTVWEPAS